MNNNLNINNFLNFNFNEFLYQPPIDKDDSDVLMQEDEAQTFNMIEELTKYNDKEKDENFLIQNNAIHPDSFDPSYKNLLSTTQFAHIHAGSIAENSSLEGYEIEKTLSHFIHFIKHFGKLEIEILEELVTLLENCKDNCRERYSNLEELTLHSQEITHILKNLEPNQQYLIAGGYETKKKGAHAMLFLFTRCPDSLSLVLTVINTGGGTQYHPSYIEQGRNYILPFLNYTVPLSKIQKGIQSLLEYNSYLKDTDYFDEIYPSNFDEMDSDCYDEIDPSNFLYKKVLPAMGELIFINSAPEEMYSLPQKAGFCSEAPLHAFLKLFLIIKYGLHCGYSLYKEFKFNTYRFQTLFSFYSFVKEKNLTETEHILLSHSINKQLTYDQTRLIKVSYPSTIQKRLPILLFIRDFLNQSSLNNNRFDNEEIDWEFFIREQTPVHLVNENRLTNLNRHIDKILIGFQFSYSDMQIDSIIKNAINPSIPLRINNINDIKVSYQLPLEITSNTILDETQKFTNYTESYFKSFNNDIKHDFIYCFNKFLDLLKFPVRNESYLDLSDQESVQLSQLLSRISCRVFQSIEIHWKDITQVQLLNTLIFNQCKMLIILHKLASRGNCKELEEIPIFLPIQTLLNTLLFVNNTTSQEIKWKKIIGYLNIKEYEKNNRPFSFTQWVTNFSGRGGFQEDHLHQLEFTFMNKFISSTSSKQTLNNLGQAFCDLEGNLIPKSLALFRKQHLQVWFLLQYFNEDFSTIIKDFYRIGWLSNLRLVSEQIEYKLNNENITAQVLNIYIGDFNLNIKYQDQGIIDHHSRFRKSEKQLHSHIRYFDRKNSSTKLLSKILIKEGNLYKNFRSIKFKPHMFLTQYPLKEKGILSTEDLNKICSVFANKQFLIQEVLGFFKNRLDLLEHNEYQLFFKALFFKFDYLFLSFRSTPALIHHTLTFIQEGYDYYSHIKKLEAQLFFISISDRVSSLLNLYSFKYSEQSVLDTKSELFKLYTNPNLKKEEKGLVSLFILSHYQHHEYLYTVYLTEEISAILYAWIFYQSFCGQTIDYYQLYDGIEKSYHCMESKIQEHLQDSEARNRTFTQLIQAFDSTQSSSNWIFSDTSNNIYQDESKVWIIDIKKGEIYKNGCPLIGLPSAIRSALDEEYKNSPFKPLSKEVFQISPPKNNLPFLFVYYCPNTKKTVISKIVEHTLIYPKQNLNCPLLDSQDKEYFAATLTSQQILILSIDKTTHKIKKTISYFRNNQNELHIHSIINKHSMGNFYLTNLISPSIDWKKPLNLILKEKIEPLLWINKDTKQAILEIPCFHLTFFICSKNVQPMKAFFMDALNYYLVNPKSWQGIGKSPYVLLRHEYKNEFKVVLPFVYLDRIKNQEDPLHTDLTFDFSKSQLQAGSKSFISYFILDIDRKGNLIGQTTLEHLYLLYLYAAKSANPKYLNLAFEELKCINSLKIYSEQEIEVFDRLFKLINHINFTQNIGLYFIATHAFVKLLKNFEMSIKNGSIDSKLEDTIDEDAISCILTVYWNERLSLPSRILTAEDELIVAKYIEFIEGSEVINRINSSYKSKKIRPEQNNRRFYNASYSKLPIITFDMTHLAKDFIGKQINNKTVSSLMYVNEELFISSFILNKKCAFSENELEKAELKHELNLLRFENKRKKDNAKYLALYSLAKTLKFILQLCIEQPETMSEFRNLSTLDEVLYLFERKKHFFTLDRKTAPSYFVFNNSQSNLSKKVFQILRKTIIGYQQVNLHYLSNDLNSIPPVDSIFEHAKEFIYPTLNFDPNTSSLGYQENIWIEDYNRDLRSIQNENKKEFKVEDFIIFENELKNKIEKQAIELHALEKQILTLVHTFSVSSIAAKHTEISRGLSGKIKISESILDLLPSFIEGSKENWLAINPTLSESSLKKLQIEITHYLVLATKQQQYKRLEQWLIEIWNSKLVYTDMQQSLIEEFHLELNKTRVYDLQDSFSVANLRLLLGFEYVSNLLLTKEQYILFADMIKSVKEGKNYIGQLRMGGGKSKVLLVLLTLSLANRKLCPVICVPKELIETQKSYLSQLTFKLFKQEARTFEFSNEMPFSKRDAMQLYDLVCETISSKHYLIVTKETLQALNIKFTDLLLQGDKNSDSFDYLYQTLRILKTQGVLIIDEADSILNARSELNLSIGNSRPPAPHSIEMACEIYKFLVDPVLTQDLNLSQNKQVEQLPFVYNKIKNNLIEHFSSKFTSDFNKRQILSNYLFESSEAIPDWVPVEQQDKLDFLKMQIHTYLPLTLSKQGFKDYCFSANQDIYCAIPTKNCKPVEGSLFGTEEEMINYTIQQLLHTGVKREQASTFIKQLKKEYIYDSNAKNKKLSEAEKKFHSFCPGIDLSQVDDRNLSLVLDKINEAPMHIVTFAQHFTLPRLQIPSHKIVNNAIDLIERFRQTIGFTGTPWNHFSYPTSLYTQTKTGTDGQLLTLLRHKATLLNHPIRFLSFHQLNTCKEVIKTLLDPFKLEKILICGLVDSGALLKNFDELTIAHAYLEYFKENQQIERTCPIKGVRLFINNHLTVVLINGSLVDSEKCKLKPEELFTFFDNAHYIGTDLPLPALGVLILTLSGDLLIKDFMQAASRLRGLAKQQNIFYIGTSECELNIKNILNKNQNDTLSIDDIFCFTSLIQSEVQANDVFKQAKLSINALIRNAILDYLLEKDFSIKHQQKIFKLFNFPNIFTSQSLNKTKDSHKSIQVLQDPMNILQAGLEEYKNQIQTIDFSEIREKYKASVQKLQENLICLLTNKINFPSSLRMPKKVKTTNLAELNCEIQVQMQQMRQQENEEELNINTNSYSDIEFHQWTYPLNPSLQQKARINLHNTTTNKSLIDSEEDNVYLTDSSESSTDLYTKSYKSFLSIQDFFSECSELKPFISKFSSNIYFTVNFLPLFDNSINSAIRIPFGQRYKPITHLLIEETYSSDSHLKFYIIDQLELRQLSKVYKNYADTKKQNDPNVKLWLYDLNLRMSHHETQTDLAKKWEEDLLFKRTIFQIRLLNAEISYSETDQEFLYEKIREIEPDNFENFFKRISLFRDSKNFYKNSIVEHTVKTVRKEMSSSISTNKRGTKRGFIEIEDFGSKSEDPDESVKKASKLQ